MDVELEIWVEYTEFVKRGVIIARFLHQRANLEKGVLNG